jgi:hypothetical protein
MSILRKAKFPGFHRPRNEALAGLPSLLGARLVRRRASFHLVLERNEQTIAHSRARLPGVSGVRTASNR